MKLLQFCFVFSVFRVILEKIIVPVWNVLLNAVKEGNITLNVHNIPVNSWLFSDLEWPFVIEPHESPSVSNILNVFNKLTYSWYTPSTDTCKLIVLTAFLLSRTNFLLVTCYSLPFTSHLLLATFYSFPVTFYSLLVTFYSLFVTSWIEIYSDVKSTIQIW